MTRTTLFTAAVLFAQLLFLQPAAPAPNMPATADETYVYICTGGSSKRYHKTDSCKGLDNCQASVKKVTLAYAEKIERTPCKICYKKK